jgi:hypothetical protein
MKTGINGSLKRMNTIQGKALTVLVVGLLIALNAHAQPPVQRYLEYAVEDSINMDQLHLLIAADGGLYQFDREHLLRFDPQGQLVWGKRIDMSPLALFANCINTPEGGVLMAFSLEPQEYGLQDSTKVTNAIVRFGPNGDLEWSQRFSNTIHGDQSFDYNAVSAPPGISLTSDGLLLLCQAVEPLPAFYGFSYIIKWDPAHPELGMQWVFTNGIVQSISPLPDGGCMLAGGAPLVDPAPVFQVSRIEPTSSQQWSDGIWYDVDHLWKMGYAPFLHCANGDVVASGTIEFLPGGSIADHFAIRYGIDGSVKWFTLYDFQEEPAGCWWAGGAYASELENGQLVFGTPLHCYLSDGAFAMIRTDEDGLLLDAYRTDSIVANDSLYFPRVTAMGAYGQRIFTQGMMQSKAVGGFFWAPEKPFLSLFDSMDEDGCLLTPMTVDQLSVDTSLFYSTGPFPRSNFGGHLTSIAQSSVDLGTVQTYDLCSSITSINERGNAIVALGLTATPNPVGNSTVLHYAYLQSALELEVVDALGSSVHRESLEHHPSEGTIRLEMSNWPSGLYFAAIRGADGLVGTTRLVKE